MIRVEISEATPYFSRGYGVEKAKHGDLLTGVDEMIATCILKEKRTTPAKNGASPGAI